MTLAEIMKLTQWSEIEACLRRFEQGSGGYPWWTPENWWERCRKSTTVWLIRAYRRYLSPLLGRRAPNFWPYIKAHRHAYAQICELTPKPSDTVIVIAGHYGDDADDAEARELDARVLADADGPLDVSGVEEGSTEGVGSMSLAFAPWDEWPGMRVAASALQYLTPAEIVTHCLCEMTYHGYEWSKVRASAHELLSLWEQVEQRLDSEQEDERKSDNR